MRRTDRSAERCPALRTPLGARSSAAWLGAEVLTLPAPVRVKPIPELIEELERLAAEYRSEMESWGHAPTRKRARATLDKAVRDLSRASDALDKLPAPIVQLVFRDERAHGRARRVVDAAAHSARRVRAWLDQQAPKGGRGHLGNLLGPPPRVRLAIQTAVLLDDCRPGSVSTNPTGPLYQLTCLILEMAGESEPTRGLADVMRAAVAGYRAVWGNRAIAASDNPLVPGALCKRSSGGRARSGKTGNAATPEIKDRRASAGRFVASVGPDPGGLARAKPGPEEPPGRESGAQFDGRLRRNA